MSLLSKGEIQSSKSLVLSVHGYLSESEPQLSSLVFGVNGLSPPEIDGYLTAAELQFFTLENDLVYLSACETGVGASSTALGTLGLPYAFTVAGAANVVMTLWPIDDEATVLFTEEFFKRLKDGMSKRVALQQTKKFLINHPKY